MYQVERYEAHWGGYREVPRAFDDDSPFRTEDIAEATNRAKDVCRAGPHLAVTQVRDLTGVELPRRYVNQHGMVVAR